MKIVIDISENDYWLACNYPETLISVYAQAIKNGTPLPIPQKKEVKEIKHLEDFVNIETQYDLIENKIVGKIKYDTETIFNEGYNSCLDEILGGENEHSNTNT